MMQYNGGSHGVDWSANAPTLPNVGSSFGASGPYANYVLLQTVPQNDNRAMIDIENISGAQLLVVRDDGSAATGAAPNRASVVVLGPGSGVGAQGGSYVSQTFKGRAQVYGPSSGLSVSIFED